MAGRIELPDGFHLRSAAWHFEKLVEFTRIKGLIGEPSPHLAIMGHFCRNTSIRETAWRLSCYAATYCLPTANVLWRHFDVDSPYLRDTAAMESWLDRNWAGIVTRTERRCVRHRGRMADCLSSAARWIDSELPGLPHIQANSQNEYYDAVWHSVSGIRYFGRYIAIRFIEGLRRYAGVPAALYDVRSVGGWSPKKALAYLYPHHADTLLTENAEGNRMTDTLAEDLMVRYSCADMQVDYYVMAAMLCEYKGAFENRTQYPGWTIDQEPLLYDKVAKYWGDDISTRDLWVARSELFPAQVLGEKSGWHGTRWPVAAVLRDHGYNWNDLAYEYTATEASGDFSSPVVRQ